MRFRVDSGAFAEAVAWTARALPARPAVPVLAGMRLELPAADSQALRFSSFDYEVSARAAVDVDAEEPGEVLVSGKLLAEIARSLPDRPVEVAADDARVHLTCGSSKFTLLTLPLEDYPDLPEMPGIAGSVGGDSFAAGVRQVAAAASRDDTLPMLTGVHMAFSADSLTLAATDRYRIAVRDLWWQPRELDIDTSALVPARTLADTARSLESGTNVDIALSSAALGGGATVGAGQGMVGFENAGRRTTTRLIDSEFLKYEHRFPTQFEAQAEVSVAPLVEAVKRVALVAERHTPLRLSFAPTELLLQAGSGDDAQALEALEVNYEGEEMTIAFSPQYFLEGLNAVESPTARLGFIAPTKPAVISGVPAGEKEQPDFRYLVMPLRVA